jgi:hypothetical protein
LEKRSAILRNAKSNIGMPLRTLQVGIKPIMKLTVLCVALLVAGCGAVTTASIYEGLRTQQSLKDVGALQPSEKMDAYDSYEKERKKLKPQE